MDLPVVPSQTVCVPNSASPVMTRLAVWRGVVFFPRRLRWTPTCARLQAGLLRSAPDVFADTIKVVVGGQRVGPGGARKGWERALEVFWSELRPPKLLYHCFFSLFVVNTLVTRGCVLCLRSCFLYFQNETESLSGCHSNQLGFQKGKSVVDETIASTTSPSLSLWLSPAHDGSWQELDSSTLDLISCNLYPITTV